MNIKLVLNENIHKVSTKPTNYQELLDVIARTFKEKLPSSYDIKYKDFEDDMIIIQDDDGFKLAYETFITEKMVFLKIFLIPTKQDISDIKSLKSESKAEQKSQNNITIDRTVSEKSNDTLKIDKKSLNANEIKEVGNGNPLENNIFCLPDELVNRMTIIKNETKENNEHISKTFVQSMNTPCNFDESDFDKIIFEKSIPNVFETNVTPDLDSFTGESTIKTVNKAFEIFDEAVVNEIVLERPRMQQKIENLEKLDVNLQIPNNSKEKDMISPLKPAINVFVPLETLKEEESIIEEKSSESQSKCDDDLKNFNVQILDALDKETITKVLCLKCSRCEGTGISKKKGKPCSKCVKGYLKVDKKLSKLINHVLTYKLTTKYKKLLEINDEIGKGSISLADDKDKFFPQMEISEKASDFDQKFLILESFDCQTCSKKYGPEEIRYKSIDGDFYLCEKCEAESYGGGQDFIKIKPLAQRQAALNPNSCNLKPKCLLRKSETLSVTTSENWGSSSVCLSNKTNEIKAKLIGNPPSITTTPDSKIFQFIEVSNSGSLKWPNNVFLICVSGEFMEDFKDVPSLEKGARHEIRLELESPSKVGKYYSAWRLSYTQEGEEKKFFGPRISFEINVEVNDKKGGKKIINDPTLKNLNSKAINNSTTSADFRIYNDCDRIMLEKAKAIQKLFPNHDVSYYVEFLKKSKDRDKSIDEIIDLNPKTFFQN